MKKIIILLPVYNDWESLRKVLGEINSIIKTLKSFEFSCLIINDNSTIKRTEILKPKNFKFLQIINMKENRGHARCNAFGLRYISSNMACDYVIVMDSDGEDRPVEIEQLVEKIIQSPNTSVVAKRIKRSEGPFFNALYQAHKLITFIFTGQKINFGNYSCLTIKDVKNLSVRASLWSSFSGSVKKNLQNFNEIESIRGLRYFGPSKMSLFNLAIHSFSIIAVFKNLVLIRSIIFVFILYLLNNFLGLIALVFQILIALFNLLIFIVSLRENEKAMLSSHKNMLNKDEVTH